MPAMTRVTVSHVEPAMRRLSLWGAKLRDWPVLWEQIGRAFADAEASLFESEGADGGGENTPWAQLDENYAARKAQLYPGKPILQASGELEESLTDPERAMRLVAPDVLLYGSDVTTADGWNLAELHYAGTSKMPARNPLISIVRQREIARTALAFHTRYPKAAQI